jgi:N6-adenosine-specific RNA methylase IME4
MNYNIIYCDPPWDYKGQTQVGTTGPSGSAIEHYPTMTLAQLKELKVKEMCAKDCLLFMWSSGPHLDQAIELGKHWGFDYKQIAFMWDKVRGNPGFYTYTQCEPVLVFKLKGSKIPERSDDSRKTKQLFTEKKREHSRKPDGIRDNIRDMYPNAKRLEMFARTTIDGWDVMGNETDKFDGI